MSFSVGDEVVCVSGAAPVGQKGADGRRSGYGNEAVPVVGQHYHVRALTKCASDADGVLLVEIVNPVQHYIVLLPNVDGHVEFCFPAEQFRPVKRESIQLFKDMCASPKPLVPVAPGSAEIWVSRGK